MLISFAVTAKLICIFVFAHAKIRFSDGAVQMGFFFLISDFMSMYLYLLDHLVWNLWLLSLMCLHTSLSRTTTLDDIVSVYSLKGLYSIVAKSVLLFY